MSWTLTAVAAIGVLALLRQRVVARELAAHASHELRGPLTAAQLALDGMGLAPEGAVAVQAQLLRARLALDDLVLAPRGRRAPDHPEAVAVSDLVTDVVRTWRPVAAASGVELRAPAWTSAGGAAEPAPAGVLVVDRVRIAQAVGNLVANALEHGAGPVELRVRSADGRLRLEVRDGGAGLRAPVGVLARRRRGMREGPRAGRPRGLGLAIATGIAERHGGRLVAAPSPGGAALVLELPLLPARGEGRDHGARA